MFFKAKFLKNNDLQLILEKTADGDEKKKWVPTYYFFICDINGNRMGEKLKCAWNVMLMKIE